MATTDANGFITVENSDLFNISHANGNAAAASAVANRVTTAEGNISDIQTALGNKVDTSTYTAGMATKVNSSTYTSGMAGKVDKVDGKGLSTEDYTSAEKTKLAGIADGANNYSLPTASTDTLGGIKVGAGLSIADGILKIKQTTISPAVSAVYKNGTKLTSGYQVRASAQLMGEGTVNDPALCMLTVNFRYNSLVEEIPADSYWYFDLSNFRILPNSYYSLLPIPWGSVIADTSHKVCGYSTMEYSYNDRVTVHIDTDIEGSFEFSVVCFAYFDI